MIESSSSSRRLRVAFPFLPSGLWTANSHYLVNVLSAVHALEPGERPEIVLLVPQDAVAETYEELQPLIDRILKVEFSVPWRGGLRRRCEKLARLAGVLESPLSKTLRKEGIDAVYGGMEFGPDFRLPQLVWIADFQHLRLPEMFPPNEIAARDERFRLLVNRAGKVALSSNVALEDFRHFYPQQAHKGVVLPFVAHVPQEVFSADASQVCLEYHLPERFIYLPNQFWKHKNHRCVLEAVKQARVQCPNLVVACTGNTNDYRDPCYFGALMAEISRNALRDRMVILGTVPHSHVFQLIRQSVAVLQPSLFEGWNTAVEECKSIGKTMIVSDIAVHREQDPSDSVFFQPNDPDALAARLCDVFRTRDAGPDNARENAARSSCRKRQREFALKFISAVRSVIHCWNRRSSHRPDLSP